MSQGDFSKEKVHFNIAKLKKGGETFEIVINPNEAVAFKEGSGEIKDVLKAEDIFSDAKKGDLASKELMQELFETQNPLKIAAVILKDGEIQLTAEHRQKLRDEKKEKIIAIIHRNSIDPKTNLPHPEKRIELAMEEAKVKIDEYKNAEQQVQDIVKHLQPIIPIRFENTIFKVEIPGSHAAKMYNDVTKYGSILEEEWLSSGAWRIKVELPAGLKVEFVDELNNKTHGGVRIEEVDK